MTTSRLLFIIAVAFLSVDVIASTSEGNTSFTLEKIELSTAFVNSHDGLMNHLATTLKSPFYKLAEPARSHFIGSLVFTNQGLGSYSYQDLAGLTVSDAYRILALLGAQSTVGSVPDLVSETELDDAILAGAARGDSAEVSSALMSDPRYNTICTVHPDAPSHCDTMNGHHCTEGCG